MQQKSKDVNAIIQKYRQELENKLAGKDYHDSSLESYDYTEFKEQFFSSKINWYEKACKLAEKYAIFTPDQNKSKDKEKIDRLQ